MNDIEQRYCPTCMIRGKEKRMKGSRSRHPTDTRILIHTEWECRSCGYMQFGETIEEREPRVARKKPKAQGTEFETFLVKHFTEASLASTRLVEGGSHDLGDLIVHTPGVGEQIPFIVEARHRENMPVHTALEKAQLKAKNHPVALIWKRTKKQGGNRRRSAVGVGTVVVLDLDTFTNLIGGQHGSRPQDGD